MNKAKKSDHDNMDRFNQWDNSPEDYSPQQQAQEGNGGAKTPKYPGGTGGSKSPDDLGNRPGTAPTQ